jgi:hypothetical protein
MQHCQYEWPNWTISTSEYWRPPASESVLIITDVESVSLDPAGLEWLAGACTGLAGELTANAPAATVGPARQATSAAVGMVHADIAVNRATLSDRMVSTAAKLAAVGAAVET